MAQGLLSLPEGLAWALSWAAVALVGAFLLNPVCVAIFLAQRFGSSLLPLWRVSLTAPW